MASQKSSASAAREPQRHRGRLRVATLLDAAASLFSEKGFDGTTMTEVASRAATAIGSLYQFFPNKEVLADAVLARYAELLDASLGEIEAQAKGMTPLALADALFDLMLRVWRRARRGDRAAGRESRCGDPPRRIARAHAPRHRRTVSHSRAGA